MRFAPLILLLTLASPALPQSPPGVAPSLYYTLHIDSSDLSGYSVSIRISHAPHHFRLAMATHPEYDDRFRRYVTGFHADPPAAFTHEDSSVWTITAPGGTALINYRIQLPPSGPYHFSHRPYLRPTGGLVGDLHSFMYLVDDPHAPCRLLLELPAGWHAASGLDVVPALRKDKSGKSHFPLEFRLDSASQLLDAPILVGHLHRWDLRVNGVTHSIAYLPAAPGPPMDSIKLITNIYNIVRTALPIFGAFPYHRYTFLLEDSSEGALEHGNSVTIGIPPGALASPNAGIYEEIAHEYFHTWNLMAIRPAPYTDLNDGPQEASPGLWFSEGFTMLYADLICRWLRLPLDDSTRITHLESLITRYYADTGNVVLSPSRVSLASNVQPGPLGDYDASTHLQGELIGACLDMLIRDATDGQRSLDDVMKAIYRNFGHHQPLRDSDIEKAVTSVCECNAAHTFFQAYVYAGSPIDFNTYLHLLGLHLTHDQAPAEDKDGRLRPDTRIYPWILRDDTSVRVLVTNPNSCWAQAGLHTGDIVTGVNGHPMHSRQDFQRAVNPVHIGDSIVVETGKGPTSALYTIRITGYSMPVIRITQDPDATPKQQRLLQQWLIPPSTSSRVSEPPLSSPAR